MLVETGLKKKEIKSYRTVLYMFQSERNKNVGDSIVVVPVCIAGMLAYLKEW